MLHQSTRLVVAQGVAVLLFGIAHFVLTVMANRLVQSSPSQLPLELFNVVAYALYAAAGCVAALIGGVRPIVYGAVAGVLCAIVAIVAFGVSRDALGAPALIAMVLGAVGGFCSVVTRRKSVSR